MVLDFAMRPLFTYLRTRTATTAVFAGPQDWGNNDDGGSPLSARIDRAAGEFAALLQGTQPQQKPAALESLPFEQLLAGISRAGPDLRRLTRLNYSSLRVVVRDMKCPVDSIDLIMSERSGVEIDYCPQCRGVWLDRGELDKILDRAAETMGPGSPPLPPPPAPPRDRRAARPHSAAALQPGPAPG